MGKQQHIRLSDMRLVYHLLCETRELGRDAVAWRKHAVAGLVALSSAQTGFCMEQKIGNPINIANAWRADTGWRNPRALANWVQHARQNNLARHPAGLELASRVLAGKPFVCIRPEVVPDRTWRISEYFNTVARSTGRGEFLISYCPVVIANLHLAFCLSRSPEEKAFERRDRTLVHLFHRELVQLIESEHAVIAQSAPLANLPPRLRDTATGIIAGKSEKEIASHLRLSKHTVHHHIQRLHKQFNVTSRCELLPVLLDQGITPQPRIVL
jgi:hypothetical protein